MNEPITVTVLQDDIDNGRRQSAVDCPIARAYGRDQMLATGEVYVSRIQLSHYDNPARNDYYLPDEAVEFIDRFDAGLPVEPFKFELVNRVGECGLVVRDEIEL